MKRIAVIFVQSTALVGASLLAGGAFAKGEDLANCRYSNGILMDGRVCDALRQLDERDRAAQSRNEAILSAARQRDIEWRKEREEKEARDRQARAVQRQAEDDAQAARAAAFEREQAAEDRRAAAAEKQARARADQRKQVCGVDYQSLRVGMTIQRAQECVSPFKLQGQINRADGVVSTYTSARAYVHVMDGKIIAWGK